jgi:hypothetical protein
MLLCSALLFFRLKHHSPDFLLPSRREKPIGAALAAPRISRRSPLHQFGHLSLSFSILTFMALNDVAKDSNSNEQRLMSKLESLTMKISRFVISNTVMIRFFVQFVFIIFHVMSFHIGTIILNNIFQVHNWNQRCKRFCDSLPAMKPKNHGHWGPFRGARRLAEPRNHSIVPLLEKCLSSILRCSRMGVLTSQILVLELR